MQADIIGLTERKELSEKHFVLHNLKVDSKQTWIESGAKSISIHKSNLSIDGLVPQQMFPKKFRKKKNVIKTHFQKIGREIHLHINNDIGK